METETVYVRVPQPLYEALRDEAHVKKTSQAAIVSAMLAERYGQPDEDEGEQSS